MLILLDIDGVMETTPFWKRVEFLDDQFPAFNQRAVNCLQKIISETGASVVLTTSHKSTFTLSQWAAIFKKRGISVNSIQRLTENTKHLSRKDEILNWLANVPDASFVIIDDDRSLHDLPKAIKQKCVITSSLIGLNDEDATRAIAVLQSQELVIA